MMKILEKDKGMNKYYYKYNNKNKMSFSVSHLLVSDRLSFYFMYNRKNCRVVITLSLLQFFPLYFILIYFFLSLRFVCLFIYLFICIPSLLGVLFIYFLVKFCIHLR